MNVVKCTAGHFFDGDQYAVCPHCGADVSSGVTANNQQNNAPARPKETSLFGLVKNKTESRSKTPSQTVSNNTGAPQNMQVNNYTVDDKTESIWGMQNKQPEKPVAVPAQQGVPVQSAYQNAPMPQQGVPVQPVRPNAPMPQQGVPVQPVRPNAPMPQQGVPVQPARPNTPTPQQGVPVQPARPNLPTPQQGVPVQPARPNTPIQQQNNRAVGAPGTQSLKQAVQQASANSNGKTVSYFNIANSNSSNPKKNINPVVGWLVCVGGEHMGNSFCIYTGKNPIGRGSGNKVILDKDNSVSRDKHAIVIYEPKKKQFFIQPGDSNGLTYLNDDYIMDPKPLKAKDIIELGNSKFVFFPLCGEDFSWEEYMTKE